MNEMTLRSLRDDELYHYGVIGMKWGVRRYQPYGQGYDPEYKGKFVGSKRQMKKEFRKDNQKLKDAVINASVRGYAYSKASYKANKADAKRLMKPSERNDKKAEIERTTARTLEYQYKEAEKKAQDVVKEMRDKYGNDSVRDIIYKEDKMGNKVINEKITSGGEYAAHMLANIGGYALAVAVGSPIAVFSTPTDRTSSGNRLYSEAKSAVKRARKQGFKPQKPSISEQNPELYKQAKKDYIDDLAKENIERNKRKGNNTEKVETEFKTLKKEGYKDDGFHMTKDIDTSNGKIKLRAYRDDSAFDNPGQDERLKKLERNADKISKAAVASWVNDNYEWIKEQMPGMTKQQLQSGLTVSSIYSNGTVNIEPKKTAKQLSWLGFPNAEVDVETGKVLRTGYDD